MSETAFRRVEPTTIEQLHKDNAELRAAADRMMKALQAMLQNRSYTAVQPLAEELTAAGNALRLVVYGEEVQAARA